MAARKKSAAPAAPPVQTFSPSGRCAGKPGLHHGADETCPACAPATAALEAAAALPRQVGIRWANGAFAILSIANGGAPADYLAERITPYIHRLTKLEPGKQTSYTVHLRPAYAKDAAPSCGCDGHRNHGHCKHVEAIVALRESGRLD